MGRFILHADLDAFFAKAEQVTDPSLAGKPVVVGADPQGGAGRGVVSAASYEARAYGIKSAMPISKAYHLCPQAIFVYPDFRKYTFYSRLVMGIFRRYTPLVEQLSIDEAFLDITESISLFGDPHTIAAKIQNDVRAETGLTVSIGISGCKSVSKIASDMNKPDGITICPEGYEREFLADLSIGRLWGVGKKTEEHLKNLGFSRIRDIAEKEPEDMVAILGNHGFFIWQLANGIDDRDVSTESAEQKSFGEEHTFQEDTSSVDLIQNSVAMMIDSVLRELRRRDLSYRTMTIKVRFSDFRTITRSKTVSIPTNAFEQTKEDALTLLQRELVSGKKIRLVGISFSNVSTAEQPLLFDNPQSTKTDQLLDSLKSRYGNKISRGSFCKFSID